MLQAKQSELQNSVSQLQNKLDSISQNSEGSMSQLSKDVQKQLGEAIDYMDQFQEKIDELQYQPQEFDNKSEEASKMMDSAANKLDSANTSLQKGLGSSMEEQLANELKKNAELLAEDPDALDKELTELERERLEALRLQALKLLENNVKPSISRGGGNPRDIGPGTLVYTEAGNSVNKDTAREIAREFWFLAIQLEQRKEQPVEDEPSDSRFAEIENNFFENAAKYNSGEKKK